MRYERRKNSDGSTYYSFQYYENGKRVRLTREEIRTRFGKDITTEDDAKHCLKLLDAQIESTKLKVQRRLAWEKEFYNFSKLLEQYEIAQKKVAPNSFQNNVFYLKHYVLYYFLSVKRLNNLESWADYFEDFKTFLETAKTINTGKTMAWNSKNHAIKALNTFFKHLEKQNLISKAVKCEPFGEHLMNTRSIDDVVKPDEMEKVYNVLKESGHDTEALFFRFLYFSGMRFNEALAVSLGDLFQGEIENEFLRKKLKAYELNYFGYVVADSQFGGMDGEKVIRLPFKGRKKIEEKFNRVIPVIDKVLWNSLVEVGEELHSKLGNKSPRNQLLFLGLDDTTASRRLEQAFLKAKLRYRSWHCLRHSRATLLIGETSDTMLARVWLGHNSPRTIEKYNHIYQAVTREAKAKETTGKKFGLKKV